MAENAASWVCHFREDIPWHNEVRQGLLCAVSLDDIAHRDPSASWDIGWLAPKDHSSVFSPQQPIGNMIPWAMSRAAGEWPPVSFKLFEAVRVGHGHLSLTSLFWRAIQPSPEDYNSAVLHNTVHYGAVLHITVHHLTLLPFAAFTLYRVLQCCTAPHCTIQHRTFLRSIVPHVTLLSLAVRYPLLLRDRSGGE